LKHIFLHNEIKVEKASSLYQVLSLMNLYCCDKPRTHHKNTEYALVKKQTTQISSSSTTLQKTEYSKIERITLLMSGEQ